MASRSAMSMGATVSTSMAAWPCSSCGWMCGRRRVIGRRRWLRAASESARNRWACVLAGGEQCGQLPDGDVDVLTEKDEQRDADGCDEGEDDAVLGHCLAFLALDIVLHPLEQERREHVIHLGVVVLPTARTALRSGRTGGRSSRRVTRRRGRVRR